jgi:hypothetical protein
MPVAVFSNHLNLNPLFFQLGEASPVNDAPLGREGPLQLTVFSGL